MIYFIVDFPIFNSIDVRAAAPVNKSKRQSQSDSHPAITLFRSAQVNLELLEKTAPLDEQKLKLSEKDEKKLVEQGVIYYQDGEREKAKKAFEYTKVVFPENYTVPYYLGLIYLEEGKRSDAIAEWQQYVFMDPNSEDSLKIQKYLTLLIREEAVENARQAVANEDALLRSPVDDNTVAVTTFKNLGSENLELLGKGIAAMLIHDLSQIPGLQVVERVNIVTLLQEMNLGTSGLVDQKTAPKIGKLLKSKHVTTGSLTDLEKENLEIFPVVVDADQISSIDSLGVQGTLKEFYHLEKMIACIIIEDLGRDCNKMPDAFGKIHTKSLVALTAFSVGYDYLDQEKYDEAREEFQKAIDEDPDFDLAKQALIFTPTSAMLNMTPLQMILALSYSGPSFTVLDSASATTTDDGEDDGIGGLGVTTIAVAGVAAAVGVAMAAGGGGGGEDSASPLPSAEPLGQANLTGAWTGTWTDSSGNDNGSISLNLTQAQGSNSVSGSATITGTNCALDGAVSGTISGDSFQANITGSGAASFTASYTPIPTPTSMNGFLEVTSGACALISGPFTTSITGGITIKW
jgi:tetratricopeptide (TPR) repeat protein